MSKTHSIGTWTTGHDGHGGMYVYARERQVGFVSSGSEQEANARLICAAPALLAALSAVEWTSTFECERGDRDICFQTCPTCGGIEPDQPLPADWQKLTISAIGHTPSCSLAAALAAATLPDGGGENA